MTEKIKFDEAMTKLESIVERLENGDLSLEESLAIFEEGIKLARLCTKQLDEVERRIEMLIKGEDGELKIVAFAEDSNDDGEPE